MRFFWPIRERALSSDSEASTASQSSLASDASFYSAADEAGSDWFDFRPISDEAGVGVHTFAPVSASTSGQNGALDAPRAVPLLGTGCDSAAATSGTCPGHAAPIARQAHTRAEASGAQAEARPPRSLPRRFATARLATDPAGHPAGLVGPEHLGPTIPESLASQAVQPLRPESAEHTQASRLPLGAPPNAGPGAAHTPPPDLQARPMAGQGPRPAPPPHSRAQDPPCEVAPPGRAAGRLPDPVAPGASLAAATARALAVSHWPWELAEDSSDDEDGQDDPAAAPEPRQDPMRMLPRPDRAGGMLHDDIALGAASARAQAAPAGPHDLAGGPSATAATQQDRAAPPRPVQVQEVLAPPGRAGGMLPDSVAVGSAPSAIASSPAAAAAAAPATAAAAAHAVRAAARADVEHHGHARPPQELTPSARLRVELLQGGASSSSGSGTTPEDDGNGDDAADSSLVLSEDVAVPMDVDHGTRCPPAWQQPPPELRVGSKRRRLNADDGDDARRQDALLQEDEAGVHAPALRPSAASAQPASVLAVYAHNASRFDCTLCVYTAGSFAALKRHRDSRHRRTAFLDKFSAGCACGTPFDSRLAAARHAPECASPPSSTSATAPTTAGASSPTDAGADATVTAAAPAPPDLPRQVATELTASPPLVSPSDAEVQATGTTDTKTRWSPPLSRVLVASRIAGRLSAVPPPHWGPPLPRATVAARIAARLAAAPAPRWGPPLPRSVVVSRIADRLLPAPADILAADDEAKESEPMDWTAAQLDEETKESGPPAATPATTDVDMRGPSSSDDVDGEWLLRFDGACRANPGPGGAGAALFKPSGPVVWTCSHYDPSSSGTNNTAEYTALLLGARAAADHGVKRLRVEGDSTLVIQQARGIFAARSTRLRAFRNRVKAELARIERVTLHHIDRQANGHADRLANAGLDRRRTKTECSIHPDGIGCTSTTVAATTPAEPAAATLPAPAPPATATPPHDDHAMNDHGDVDDGEVYATMRIGPDAAPQRRPRLRLRKLTDEEYEEAGATVERLAATLAAKIEDATDWETAEGYITALPYTLYDKLQPYSQQQRRPQPPPQPPRQQQQQRRRHQQQQEQQQQQQRTRMSRSSARRRRRQRQCARRRPPRVTRHHREHRLDEALDDLRAVETAAPSDRRTISRARRRVGRINAAAEQQRLRHQFGTAEKACVEGILAKARDTRTAPAARAASGAPHSSSAEDEGTCPITSEHLHRHFTEVNTPKSRFDAMAPVGAKFRAALARLPAATEATELLTDAPTPDEIEDQLQRANGASSPGLDGVGYDTYKLFNTQLLPVLHAAFQCCWRHQRVPQSWKQGTVRLIYKKGSREDPANWRPICLQQVIYKTYAGLLARRFTRWLDANGRHAEDQKGFRAVNGCGEHNFLASTLIDHARRSRKELHMVWYDLKNAFGSVPQELLWEVLERMGAPPGFVQVCKGLYKDAAFTVGNAADGQTDPVTQLVGVFQGCPLSPHLFTAAISPLLHALRQLHDTGVKLSTEDRPGASAFADDLKIFSGTVDGIRRQHALVVDFLSWTGMEANPAKCCTMSVQRDSRGVLAAADLGLQLATSPIPALDMTASYAYLGIGDGFDHARRRIELAPKLRELKDDTTALLQSGLAPWQVVKAIKVYLYPRVEYALRHLRPFAQQLQGYDRHLIRGLRHLLRLPTTATTSFFYSPVSRGGLGLLPLTELHAALQIAHGWQMLNSKDPVIQRIARTQLRLIADRRHRLDPEHWGEREEELCALFLNTQLAASGHAQPKRRNGDIGSLWVDVQRHLRTLGLQLETAPAQAATRTPALALQLRVPHHDKWLTHRDVLRHVKLHLKQRHWQRWTAMKDQGKTARSHGGAGSGFLTRPRGMWETDYRFAVAGRLNQLDTHSVLKRRRLQAHDRCRQPGCTRSETLAHVLNHCDGTMDAVRGRHDDALKIIERTLLASSGDQQDRVELRVNQTVPSLAGPALRPDLQLYNHTKKTVAVVDLAVAFEEQASDDAESSALARIAAHKRTKYDPIKRHLEHQGWKVHLSALVYGSLGAVASGNHKVYTEHLGLLKRDAKRLDRQLSAACIQSSRRIWNLHCSQHRARQHQARPSQGPRGSRATETGGTPSQRSRR